MRKPTYMRFREGYQPLGKWATQEHPVVRHQIELNRFAVIALEREGAQHWFFDVCGEAFDLSLQFTQPKGYGAGFVYSIKSRLEKARSDCLEKKLGDISSCFHALTMRLMAAGKAALLGTVAAPR
jgi:hypothetical protein